MKNNKLIAIVGAPRSGKSFLCQKLSEKLGYEYFLEGEQNSFPGWLMEDIKNNTNALRRILWFRNNQIENQIKAVERKLLNNDSVLIDTFWLDNMLYFDVLLSGEDLNTVNKQGYIDMKILPFPDIVIYLKNSEDNTKKFIKLGARNFDTNDEFFDKQVKPLMTSYERLICMLPATVSLVEIDRSNYDFNSEVDLQHIIDKIIDTHYKL